MSQCQTNFDFKEKAFESVCKCWIHNDLEILTKLDQTALKAAFLEDKLNEFLREELHPKEYDNNLEPKVAKVVNSVVDTLKFERTDTVMQDNVHGSIGLHPVIQAIIDTEQFQRLRRLKQLGVTHLVFPTATHTRFEHSVGTSWLAGKLATNLSLQQPELNISKVDILCVKIAGLCHDLGHGPFSHLWDGRFIPAVKPGIRWTHEKASMQIIDYMLDNNPHVKSLMSVYDIEDKDIDFIKEMIKKPTASEKDVEWPYKGRPRHMGFLYQIISNEVTGLDVDKLDYLKRDSQNLGMAPLTMCLDRLLHMFRVVKEGNDYVIATRDKEADSLLKIFQFRYTLHKKAYQHKTTVAIESMIVKALIGADKHVWTTTKDGKKLSMSDAINDMSAYCQLDDETVLSKIRTSIEPEMEEPRALLLRIANRKLYRLVGETIYGHEVREVSSQEEVSRKYSEKDVTKQLKKYIRGNEEQAEQLVVRLCKFDFGKKDRNPLDYFYYYHRHAESAEAFKLPPGFLSRFGLEEVIRVYCAENHDDPAKNADDWRVLAQAFQQWCHDEGLPEPTTAGGTPIKNKIQNGRESSVPASKRQKPASGAEGAPKAKRRVKVEDK